MLVLSRVEGDSISVPDIDLAIRVLKISGGRIRLGIEAPDHVRVQRTEALSSEEDQAETDTRSLGDRASLGKNRSLSKRIAQATLALQMAERYFQRGENAKAEATLDRAFEAYSLDGGPPSSVREEPSAYFVDFPAQDSFRILLIENEASAVNSLDELLEIPNIEIQIASDVTDAISHLDAGSHDLLLLEPSESPEQITGIVQRIRSDRRFNGLPIAIVNLVASDRPGANRHLANVLA